MRVPFVDLSRQNQMLDDEITATWSKITSGSSFVLGPEVASFERDYASYCGVSHCIGVGNGTDAIELALRALGIGPGDEVIVPANTFIATALAVMRAGALVRLVDCLPGSYLMDVEQALAAVTEATRAIVPVHLFGQAAGAESLLGVGPEISVVEDAAQSHGATRWSRPTGSVGKMGATSFYPSKNLGAFGDAGAVLTSDDELAERVKALRNWGSTKKYHHPAIGFNSRLDTLQAAVLSAKLPWLADWNRQRQAAAARYRELLGHEERVSLPVVEDGNDHVYHLFVIEVDRRDLVLAGLRRAGVEAAIHYPLPIHLQEALAFLGYRRGDFPHSERAADRMISLPMFPGITSAELEYVADSLVQCL